MKVDLSTQQIGKLRLEREERQTRCSTGLELDENVDVAFGAEVGPDDGPEKGETANPVTPADARQAGAIDGDGQGGHASIMRVRARSVDRRQSSGNSSPTRPPLLVLADSLVPGRIGG